MLKILIACMRVAGVNAGLFLGLFVAVSALCVHGLSHAASSQLGGLIKSNLFDPERKPWPDAVPVVPPPPPPPVPAPVTEADLQVYGVIVVGNARKAFLKLGPRFANVPTGANGFSTVDQGAVLGEFVLAQVEADQILLQASGGQQWVRFNTKKDRVAAAIPGGGGRQPFAAPTPAVAAPEPGNAPGQAVGPGGQSGLPGSGNVVPPPIPAAPGSQAAIAASMNGAGSLAAAIAAAQSNAQSPAATGAAPVLSSNPFLQLLQTQQK